MADRIVQLVDKDNNNIFPVTTNDAPIITVTTTDPGEGSSLAANHFVAVTGTPSMVGSADISPNAITTAKIANSAVTIGKIDTSSLLSAFAFPVFIGKATITKQTYNNATMKLQDLVALYASTGVSSSIVSNTNWKFTLPTTGTYVAEVYASLWTGADSWDYMLMEARINGVGIGRAMAPKPNGNWAFVNCQGVANITNGQAVTVYLNTNGNNFSDGNMGPNDSHVLVKIYRTS